MKMQGVKECLSLMRQLVFLQTDEDDRFVNQFFTYYNHSQFKTPSLGKEAFDAGGLTGESGPGSFKLDAYPRVAFATNDIQHLGFDGFVLVHSVHEGFDEVFVNSLWAMVRFGQAKFLTNDVEDKIRGNMFFEDVHRRLSTFNSGRAFKQGGDVF
jgi:hypothetical protein